MHLGSIKKTTTILTISIVFLMFFANVAFADSDTVTVYFTLSQDGEFVVGNDADNTVLAHIPVTIEYFDLEDYGLENYYRYEEDTFENGGGYIGTEVLEQPTLLHLLIRMLEFYYLGDEEGSMQNKISTEALNIIGNPTSMYMQEFWGHDENLMYYVDHQYPLMAENLGATADYILLYDGMDIDVAMFDDWSFWTEGAFAAFDQTNVYLDVDEPVTLTMNAYPTDGIMYGELSEPVPMPGEGVMVSDNFGRSWSLVDETDSNGETTLCFDTDGVYYITFDKDNVNYESGLNMTCVAPPISVITVGDEDLYYFIQEIMALPLDAELTEEQQDFLEQHPNYAALKSKKM